MSSGHAFGYRVVSERLTELCKRHGSLRKAAKALKISPAYLSKLIHGEKQNPSPAILRAIAVKRIIRWQTLGSIPELKP